MKNRLALPALMFLVSLVAACGGGGGGGGGGPTAPSDLSYATPDPFVVGQAIATLTPSVTGTVTSYSVSPALPAGLALDTTSGTISGTPTAVTPTANYTVTATNSAGSTSTPLPLTVNATPPAAPAFSYGTNDAVTLALNSPANVQPTSTGGPVTTWAISPALPAGLAFSKTDGSITGTPTAAMEPTQFTITASNAGGSAPVILTLSVQQVLVDLGHVTDTTVSGVTATRVLTLDVSGHWVLWDYAAATTLAQGKLSCGSVGDQCPTVERGELIGDTFALWSPTGIQVRSSADGSLRSTITGGFNDFHLAGDASYVCAANASAITAFGTDGKMIAGRNGNYSAAKFVCAPGQMQVANGALAADVIETVTLPSGTSTVGPQFSGVFSSWFLDGNSFFTNAANNVWVYSSAGTQLDFTVLPTLQQLTGQGDWFWTYDTQNQSTFNLNIYKVGTSTAPTASYPYPAGAQPVPSAATIGVLKAGGKVDVVDLSAALPAVTSQTTLIGGFSYAAVSPAQWVMASSSVVVDGASLSGTPRYYGYGQALSIAGSGARVAVATASGKVLIYALTGGSIQDVIDTAPSTSGSTIVQVAMSTDGTILATRAAGAGYGPGPFDASVHTYGLPGAAIINTWPYTSAWPTPIFITLASSGATLGQVVQTPTNFLRQVTPASGGDTIWSDTQTASGSPSDIWAPMWLSANGTLIAATNVDRTAATIYLNGALVSAVPGAAEVWMTDNELLAARYQISSGFFNFVDAGLYDAAGHKLASPPLAGFDVFDRLQPAGPDGIYDPIENEIFSLTTGETVWQEPAGQGVGAVSGAAITYASGTQVVVQRY